MNMDTIWGNVFRPGQGAILCRLEVKFDVLVATPKSTEEQTGPFKFPLKDKFLSFGGDDGTQVVLKNDDDQTLYAERVSLEPHLQDRGDSLFRQRISTEKKRVVKSRRLSLAAFFGFFLGCALLIGVGIVVLNWGVDRSVDQIPVSWEESLGEAVVEAHLEGNELIDPRLVDPVQKIVDRIAAAEPGQPYTLTLHVVENPQINAFAAPGGHIVVFTGLLEETQRPEELAGVLAHEFQHVFQRHGLRGMVHSVKWQALAALVVGDVGTVQQVVLGHAPQFLTLAYGRSLEEEADIEGVELLVAAQIDPQGMADFFKILQKNEQIEIPEFISSHPDTENRIHNLEEWIADHPNARIEPIDVDWEALKQALVERNSLAPKETVEP
jgi:Zn-dependent protease with chaperone function